ncbi:MAG: glutamate mutase L [Lachnospiraceae bacterium]|nr:glutamate mutase L [Lachnospiraceae bacterium]
MMRKMLNSPLEDMDKYILIDFGSTFTKAAVVSAKEKKIVFTTMTPSTVHKDAKLGLDICYSRIKQNLGTEVFDGARKLATSSAAGGLRMIVVGLTRNLSISAGRNAAFSAGAKIIKTYTGLLTSGDIEAIDQSKVEIIFLCGGFEGGNESGIIHNAKMLGRCRSNIPIIYSGNSKAIHEVRKQLLIRQKECALVDNIIPEIGKVNSGPAEELIRQVFMSRITDMKGLDKVRGELENVLMPTPAAVLRAGALLSRGTENKEGLGPLMIVDVGGATTDVYSHAESTLYESAKCIGSPEPYSKRTVEGDLGMRESSDHVIAEIGYERVASDLGITVESLRSSIDRRLKKRDFLPSDDTSAKKREALIDQQIAKYAVNLAARRHAGHAEAVHSTICKFIQCGKNLTEIATVIGTGGQVVKSREPKEILKEVLIQERDKINKILLPESCCFMIDADYIFYAAGLLSQIDPDTALSIMKASIKEV